MRPLHRDAAPPAVAWGPTFGLRLAGRDAACPLSTQVCTACTLRVETLPLFYFM